MNTSKLIIAIRSITFYVLFSIDVFVFTTLICIASIFSLHAVQSLIRCWSRSVSILLQYVCNIRYEIEGKENLKDLPAVICSKHQSTWETIMFPHIFPGSRFVVKKELLKIPFYGISLRLMQPIAIDRSKNIAAMRKVIKEGKETLKAGRSIIIFPEGTRVLPHKHKQLQKGGILLAKKTGFPIIPIAHNAGSHWMRKSFLKQPGVITLVVGKKVITSNKTTEELKTELHDWLLETMKRIEK
ncbi:MAG: 1-acyl-sn-glycerol-3-phosphate acyltransferase [Thiotrichales bacterium]|nr:MAG: 1-acyl-sn-glycerol-3-phosphate acyltransferase [Thiotrichales bacterium]